MRRLITALSLLLLTLGVAAIIAPAKTLAAAHPTTPCTQRQLRQGAYNNTCVEYIQKMLNTAGSANLVVDGDFGPKTKKAVKTWQDNKNLAIDGIVGPQTWGSLCSYHTRYPQLAKDAGCDKQRKPVACNKRTFSTRTNPRDTCVGTIQVLLNLAKGSQLSVDSTFGTATKTAVRAYQQEKRITKDGIVGPQTWSKLCKPLTGQTEAVRDLYKTTAQQAGCRL
jgi:peptidoglycan hydrolase-like protein with peptidoglycan-binding domain